MSCYKSDLTKFIVYLFLTLLVFTLIPKEYMKSVEQHKGALLLVIPFILLSLNSDTIKEKFTESQNDIFMNAVKEQSENLPFIEINKKNKIVIDLEYFKDGKKLNLDSDDTKILRNYLYKMGQIAYDINNVDNLFTFGKFILKINNKDVRNKEDKITFEQRQNLKKELYAFVEDGFNNQKQMNDDFINNGKDKFQREIEQISRELIDMRRERDLALLANGDVEKLKKDLSEVKDELFRYKNTKYDPINHEKYFYALADDLLKKNILDQDEIRRCRERIDKGESMQTYINRFEFLIKNGMEKENSPTKHEKVDKSHLDYDPYEKYNIIKSNNWTHPRKIKPVCINKPHGECKTCNLDDGLDGFPLKPMN